jgi:hypothetical protein
VALWVVTNVSEEVAASIFKFQVTSRKTETAGSFEKFVVTPIDNMVS